MGIFERNKNIIYYTYKFYNSLTKLNLTNYFAKDKDLSVIKSGVVSEVPPTF